MSNHVVAELPILSNLIEDPKHGTIVYGTCRSAGDMSTADWVSSSGGFETD
jgi:hypothetical protein